MALEPATNAPPRRYDWSAGSLLITGLVVGFIIVLVLYWRAQTQDEADA